MYDRTAMIFWLNLEMQNEGVRTSQFDELLELEAELVPFDEPGPPEDLAFVAHVLPQYKCVFDPSAYLGRMRQYCELKVRNDWER